MTRLTASLFAAALLLGQSAGAAEIAVAPRPVDDLKAVFGVVRSVDTALARTRIGGTIDSLMVDEGSQVETGQQIAVVIDPKFASQIAGIDARLASLKAQRQLAATELQRMRDLRQAGTVPQSRLDSAQTQYDVVVQQIAATAAEREVIVRQQKEGAVLAPRGGRVLRVPVTDGSVVMPGETVAEIAAENFILRLELPERHARFMQQGDSVWVASRGLIEGAATGEAPRQGKVRQVYPELDRGRVVADVEVEGLGDYFVGERTLVWVSTGKRQAFLVPPEAVSRRSGVDFVTVKGIGEVAVQTGQRLPDGLEILSGLRAGDIVVTP